METEKKVSRITAMKAEIDNLNTEIAGLRMNQRKWVRFDDMAGDSHGAICPDCFERLAQDALGDFHKVDPQQLDPICRCDDCGKEVRDA